MGEHLLNDYNNRTFEELNEDQKNSIREFEFNVIEITDIDKDSNELNLMFLRFQLRSAIECRGKIKRNGWRNEKICFREIWEKSVF